MTTDGHPEMFFFPSNHKPNFSGLQSGKLYAFYTISVHMPQKIISQSKTVGFPLKTCFIHVLFRQMIQQLVWSFSWQIKKQ